MHSLDYRETEVDAHFTHPPHRTMQLRMELHMDQDNCGSSTRTTSKLMVSTP